MFAGFRGGFRSAYNAITANKRIAIGGIALSGAVVWPLMTAADATNDAPVFSLDKPYCDESTYWGRVSNMMRLIDSRLLFIGDAELKASQDLIAQFKELGHLPPNVSDAQMWRAKQVLRVSFIYLPRF